MYKKLVFILLGTFLFWQTAAAAADTTIVINAIGGLQYDLLRFQVRPNVKVKLQFTNKDDMSHNLLITEPGSRLKVVNAATELGNKGEEMNYIPKSTDVLWSIPILTPGETKTLTFTSPQKAGVYPYVCTYPGHGIVMYGAMYVTDKPLPPLKNDSNIPPARRDETARQNNHQSAHHHSFTEKKPPFMYRIFLPEASPAAIAVHLPQSLSYCWDASECRLRYAWQGDFIDNTDIWKGHHDSYGSIMGQVFYRDKTDFPLHTDKPGNIPIVQFKGYKLIDRYPEFHYTIDGIEVFELIKPKKDGTGLIRTFRIPKTSRVIWFVFDYEDGVKYGASGGTWIKNALRILPAQAGNFSIFMTKNK